MQTLIKTYTLQGRSLLCSHYHCCHCQPRHRLCLQSRLLPLFSPAKPLSSYPPPPPPSLGLGSIEQGWGFRLGFWQERRWWKGPPMRGLPLRRMEPKVEGKAWICVHGREMQKGWFGLERSSFFCFVFALFWFSLINRCKIIIIIIII